MSEIKVEGKKKIKKRLRNHIIRAWLSENEYQILKEKTDYCKMSISAYIREMVMNGFVINFQPFSSDLKAVTYELNRIGNNINQIAHRVNMFSAISNDDFEELKKSYDALFGLYMERFYEAVK